MFIDQSKIEVRSGKGGDGAIAFLRLKFMPHGGPAGGNGGRGGSIYFRANKSINTLFAFRHSKCIIAEDGEKGGIKNQYGRGAEDVYVDVPVGTVIYVEPEHEFLGDLNEDGKIVLVAKGGRGGRGNACFASSTNRVPKIAENGEPGEIKKLTLELKLLADVGLVGYPSVGKSTLLSIVSRARPEIADYEFTTLEPNLGVVNTKDGRSFVMADLPGLIKGAHEGKGLGLKFLRHIQRCRVIIHLVSMDGIRDPYESYVAIRDELDKYGFGLINRPEIIVASKMDEEGALERYENFIRQVNKEVIKLSALTNEGVEELKYKSMDLLEKTPMFPLYDEHNNEEEIKVYRLDDKAKDFELIHTDNHTWVIKGEKIEKYYKMCNISTDEGMMKLITHLRNVGVDNELAKRGAKDGDTVILMDFEFEYIG